MATPSRVNYDEYWSSEARELKASALAGERGSATHCCSAPGPGVVSVPHVVPAIKRPSRVFWAFLGSCSS
jgi:hypothetical protein